MISCQTACSPPFLVVCLAYVHDDAVTNHSVYSKPPHHPLLLALLHTYYSLHTTHYPTFYTGERCALLIYVNGLLLGATVTGDDV